MTDFDDHAEHVRIHNEFVRVVREDWFMRYRMTPWWRRRLIDWLMR